MFDVTMKECPFNGITSYGIVWRKDVLLDVSEGVPLKWHNQLWQSLEEGCVV